MKSKLTILIFLISLIGCSSFKESVGEYVTEAIHQKVLTDVDNLLEKRGLSRSEIKNVVDQNGDGKIDRAEILSTTKEATRDAVLLEAKKMVDQQITNNRATFVNTGDLSSKMNEFWLWVMGLISAYLGKQIYSAKKDSKRDQRLAIMEKLIQRDIDGDGNIGNIPIVGPTAENTA